MSERRHLSTNQNCRSIISLLPLSGCVNGSLVQSANLFGVCTTVHVLTICLFLLQNKVMRTTYVWVLCRDQSVLDPSAAWRLLDLSANSVEQWLWFLRCCFIYYYCYDWFYFVRIVIIAFLRLHLKEMEWRDTVIGGWVRPSYIRVFCWKHEVNGNIGSSL